MRASLALRIIYTMIHNDIHTIKKGRIKLPIKLQKYTKSIE